MLTDRKDSGGGDEGEGTGTASSAVTYRRGSPLELTELLLTESAIKHHVLNAYVGWFAGWKDLELT